MKRLIIFFLLVLASIWLGLKVYEQPGYILVLYQHWAIETTVWFLSLLLLLAIFVFHLLFSLIRGTAHLPRRLEAWWQTHKREKSIRLFKKGYLELLEGREKVAEKALLKSAHNKELSFVSYLIAAQAADEQQATIKRDRHLLQASKRAGKKSYVVEIMQVQFFLKHYQPEEALSLLINLRQQHPKNPYLLKLQTQTYMQLQDWYHLRDILRDLKKYQVFDEKHYQLIEKETYLRSFKDHFFTDFSEVQILWNKVPRHLRHDPDILTAYATHLNRWNRSAEAEEMIRKELKKHFNSQLMEYYVSTRSEEPAKQLALGEKYLKEHADDPRSLRGMGILCLRNRLWGQARDYLESSSKMLPCAETYSALGYVYEKLGENDKALLYYRKGVTLAP